MPDTLILNRYINHLSRFRDECLERSPGDEIPERRMRASYDRFCLRYCIVHRKILTRELPRELARLGVTSRQSETHYVTTIYVDWRLTPVTERAIRRGRRR